MPIQGKKYPNTQENVDKAPQSHGVYQFYNGETITYIGQASGTSVTIRSRLQAHKRGDEGACTQAATDYKREETEAAISREEALLVEYANSHGGQLPRCNSVMPGGR